MAWRGRAPQAKAPHRRVGVSNYHRRLDRGRWARVRRKVLDSAGWRCGSCERWANHVHHRIPLRRGGAAYDLTNLEVRCRRCHREEHLGDDRGVQPPGADAWRKLVRKRVGEGGSV